MLADNGLADTVQLMGRACWKIIGVKDHPAAPSQDIKTFLATRLFDEGVLTNGSHNICYAHNDEDLAQCEQAYAKVIPQLASLLADGRLSEELGCDPVRPIFSVRNTDAN